jgi:hypothetical protein
MKKNYDENDFQGKRRDQYESSAMIFAYAFGMIAAILLILGLFELGRFLIQT